MKNTLYKNSVMSIAAAIALSSLAAGNAGAEERTINAFSPIATTGQLLQTGSNLASFAGISTGIMIIESPQGLANAGNVSCTVSLEISTSENETIGVGRCTVVGTEGNRLYGGYTCTGTIGFGCKGEFTIDAGTGEFADAKGTGEFMIRSLVAETAFARTPTELAGAADGIAIWQDLKITTEPPAPVNN